MNTLSCRDARGVAVAFQKGRSEFDKQDKAKKKLGEHLASKIFSYRECSERYGVTYMAVYFWVTGQRIPDPVIYERIKLDYDLDDSMDYVVYERKKTLKNKARLPKEIQTCSCGGRFLITRQDQDTCIRCINHKTRLKI